MNRAGGERIRLALLAIALLAAAPASAQIGPFSAQMSADQEVAEPPVVSIAAGVALLDYDFTTHELDLQVVVQGIALNDLSSPSPFHIHVADAGENGGVIIALGTDQDWSMEDTMIVTNQILDLDDPGVLNPFGSFDDVCPAQNPGVSGGPTLAECILFFEQALESEGTYLNLHTMTFPLGEIRGQLPEPTGALPGLAAIAALALLRRRA